jgi:hypothetical protein
VNFEMLSLYILVTISAILLTIAVVELIKIEKRRKRGAWLDMIIEGDKLQAKRIIEASTPERNFERYCEWNGIIGYSERIIDALDSLRAFADVDGEL